MTGDVPDLMEALQRSLEHAKEQRNPPPEPTPNLCGHTVTTPRYLWTCIRPPHGWTQPYVENNRRKQGKTITPDRHVYTATPLQDGNNP